MQIPDPGRENYVSPDLPPDIAEISQTQEAPEASPFFISFARYNAAECEIDGLQPKMAKKALRTIRDIGVNICDSTDFSNKLPKLKVKPIDPSGDYKKLYKGLPPDAEIHEAKIDSDTGRLFFFLVERILYVVAVRESHYNTH